MSKYSVTLTKGHVLRHAPAQSAPGEAAAIIDIAQDLLSHELTEEGVLELVAFKGGTALRKVFTGARGRFSTDLDFSFANLTDEPAEVQALITDAIDRKEIGPFRYRIEERRGRAHIAYASDLGFNVGELRSKLDIGQPGGCRRYRAPGCRYLRTDFTAALYWSSQRCGSRRTLRRRSRGSTVGPSRATPMT